MTVKTGSYRRWRKWGFTLVAIHTALFLFSVLTPTIVGYFYREESPLLFLIYSLPLYLDFPVSFLLSWIFETMRISSKEYLFLAALFLAGTFYWFIIGSILGLMLSGRNNRQQGVKQNQ